MQWARTTSRGCDRLQQPASLGGVARGPSDDPYQHLGRRAPTFRPHFTLGLIYLVFFFVLYALLLILPSLLSLPCLLNLLNLRSLRNLLNQPNLRSLPNLLNQPIQKTQMNLQYHRYLYHQFLKMLQLFLNH